MHVSSPRTKTKCLQMTTMRMTAPYQYMPQYFCGCIKNRITVKIAHKRITPASVCQIYMKILYKMFM